MRKDYKRIGDFIKRVNEKNELGNVDLLLGVNLDKEFFPSVANTVGTDMTRYNIIKKGQFGCKLMSVGRDKKLPISRLTTHQEALISSAYFVFEVKDEEELHPDYLMMWFSRSESDRYLWFLSGGDIRGRITWDEFTSLPIKVPTIEKQREIVAEYQAVENKIKTNEQICEKLEAAAQALYKHWFVDFEFPNSPPPEGCPKDGVVNPPLEGCPKDGVVNPPLEGCPKDGVVNPPLEETTTPKEKEGMLNSPPPEGCPKDGVVSKHPKNSIINPQTKDRVIARNTKNYMSLPYNPKLKDRARKLRKAGNLAEVLFWKQVRNKQFLGLDFDRQKIIGNYIVDFYNANHQLVIEIDGSSHDDKEEYDAKRQAYLEGLGLTVVRFTDVEVKKQIDAVMRYLEDYVEKLEMKYLERNEGMLEKEKNRPERSVTVGKEGKNHPERSATVVEKGKNHPAFQAPLQRRGIIGYKSSGGAMVYNEELEKEIPEGWENGTLEDIYKFQYGKGNRNPDNAGIYPVYGSNGIIGGYDKYNNEDAPVIGHIGVNAGIIVFAFGKHFVTYNGVMCFLKKKESKWHSYLTLKSMNLMDQTRGSSQPFVSYDMLYENKVLIPDSLIVKVFESKANIIYSKLNILTKQINILSQFQEVLLSRMIKN